MSQEPPDCTSFTPKIPSPWPTLYLPVRQESAAYPKVHLDVNLLSPSEFFLNIFIYLFGCARVFREGDGTPLQSSCLENPRDGGAWWAAVHGVAKSRTWLSDFTFTFHFHALEKDMATHSSVLAWRNPGTEEPGGLPSMGSRRVGHDWSDLAVAAVLD